MSDDDIVARLRDPRWAGEGPAAADEITRLRADLAAAHEALKPFAKECDRLVTVDNMPEQVLRPTITAGELRCARAALKGDDSE